MRVILIDKEPLLHQEGTEVIPLCEETYDGYDKSTLRTIIRGNLQRVITITHSPELGLEK